MNNKVAIHIVPIERFNFLITFFIASGKVCFPEEKKEWILQLKLTRTNFKFAD